MILELLDGAKEHIEDLFKDTKFKSERDSKRVPITVYKHYLEQETCLDVENQQFPYIILRTSSGKLATDKNNRSDINLDIIIGLYDNAPDNQGTHDVITVIERLALSLIESGHINNKYTLTDDISWGITEEDTAPYFFGALQCQWKYRGPSKVISQFI